MGINDGSTRRSSRGLWRASVPLCITLSAAVAGAQAETIASRLLRIHDLLRESRIEEAMTALEEAMEVAKRDEDIVRIVDQEELLYQRAAVTLNYADRLTNPRSYKAIARQSRQMWMDYIEWYHALTDTERQQLRPHHDQITRATAYLGNANVRSGDMQQLYADYTAVKDVAYFGPAAIEVWKNTLYQCPDWTSGDRTQEERVKRVCDDACTSEWLSYAATLSEWAPAVEMRESSKARYLREAEQIEAIADACGS